MARHGPLGMSAGDRYRNISEALIIEMVMLAGWAYELPSTEAAEASKEALQTWTEIGLGFRRGSNGERFFDPVEVNNFLKWACLEGRDNFWTDRYVRTGRRLVANLAAPGPASVGADGERRFVVDYKRTFNLRAIAAGSKLRLRIPLPLTGDYLGNLEVTPEVETAGEAQIKLAPGRMEVRMVTAGEAEATLGARLSFTARPQQPGPSLERTKPDRELYLRDREGLIVVSERIRALARSQVGTGAPAAEAVRAFWDYIFDELRCGSIHYDQVDPALPGDSILDSGWFDCRMGAALLATLCRAHGIPARLVGGHLLYEVSPTNHYWAEVWLDDRGWTPFDFLSWDLSCGGRDPEWRDYFFGRVDHRLVSERLPREFIGTPGVPIPEAWCVFQLPRPGGVEIGLVDVDGTPVYADTIRVVG